MRQTALERGEVGPHHLPDKDVVADAATVAGRLARVDAERLLREQTLREDGDDAGLAVRVLPGPVDVRVAQNRRLHAERCVGREVAFDRELGGRVGAEWRRRGLFGRSVALGYLPVDGAAGRGENEPADAMGATGLEDVQRADEVHRCVEQRLPHADRNAGLRGLV